MGMFDHVVYSAPCAKCGEVITSWQSKSGRCMLETLDPSEVEYFYGSCTQCGQWHEYNVVLDRPKLPYHVVRSFPRIEDTD